MPQIVFLAIVGAIGWMAYRALVKSSTEAAERLRRAREESETGAVGTLEKDPETGEYRVRKD